MGRGERDAARDLVTPLLPDPDAERIVAQVDVASWSDLVPASALDEAKAAAGNGSTREALDAMLEVLDEDPVGAREAMVTVFTAVGPDDPVSAEYRAKLASRLF